MYQIKHKSNKKRKVASAVRNKKQKRVKMVLKIKETLKLRNNSIYALIYNYSKWDT